MKKTLRYLYIEVRYILLMIFSPAYRKLVRAEDARHRECEERDKRLNEEAEENYQAWFKEEEAKLAAESEEQYWAEQDRLQEEEYDRPDPGAYDCPFCGYSEANCNCDEQAEDLSDLACVDEEPLSPEMEYWNTRCTKCGMYPEFCWCGMEKLE